MNTPDLNALVAFLTTHCKPKGTNPLAILSAAQMVIDLPVEHLASFQQALDGVALEPTLAALIAHKVLANMDSGGQ